MTQLMARTNLDAKQSKYNKTIMLSGQSLMGLVNDILDISKIEAGLLELEKTPFDIVDLINRVEASIQSECLEKGLQIKTVIPPEAEGIYEGDVNRLAQILTNFAGNAVKFTEEGSISLSVEKTDTGNFLFKLTDTGPGISSEQQELIFERFQQADSSATRRHGGAGLGLFIASKLAKWMGGSVGVESTLGEGSTFWLSLELIKQDAVKTMENDDQTALAC